MDIYPSNEAWKQAKAKLVGELVSTERYKGRLSTGAVHLLECLEFVSRLSKEFARLDCYASMNSDKNLQDSKYLAMAQEVTQIDAMFGAATSFIEPEILRMDQGTIESFILQENRLEIYRHYLHDILRRKMHTGTESEEKNYRQCKCNDRKSV